MEETNKQATAKSQLRRIWDIIFPNRSHPSSPYISRGPDENQNRSLDSFFCQDGEFPSLPFFYNPPDSLHEQGDADESTICEMGSMFESSVGSKDFETKSDLGKEKVDTYLGQRRGGSSLLRPL